ncbi:MAG: DEAD/DEAH box helicase [Chloroflexi bacterium]|nr:DEAD/DEAH box helicase [Chloroflexota bacterium]
MENLRPRPAIFGDLDAPLHPALEWALKDAGIGRLYLHQAQAVNAARRGENVIVVTGTASGKTLCYNLPVIDKILQTGRARALYLFPTKALAQDQLRVLGDLTSKHMPKLKFATYDGDTPREQRAQIRKNHQIVLTNPDMLHLGILPNNTAWSKFFAQLQYVVVDEAHAYRGVFGSHVADVLRRLRRICNFYGSDPQFILTSATIANPGAHGGNLTAKEMTVVDGDGSPSGGKHFVFWNPPLIDAASGARHSTNSEATLLFSELVEHGTRTIVFAKSRKVAELILMYTRDALKKTAPELIPLVKSYRAGYLAEDRRQIERELFNGQLLGVTATNALELGVDIGTLDATILTGYPGTIASTWQQAGRSGRGQEGSLSILVALGDPLDQYLMRHPESFFGRPHEHCLVNPTNPHILAEHLLCAAHELPLSEEDSAYFGPEFVDCAAALQAEGRLSYQRRWFYSDTDPYPAQNINIRSVSGDTYDIIDAGRGGRLLESVDGATAFQQIHAGAAYLHQGETYLIEKLDLPSKTAIARKADIDYYTQPQTLTQITIQHEEKRKIVGKSAVCFGDVNVSEQVIGFKRKQQYTDTVLGMSLLDLPSRSFETKALWFDIPDSLAREFQRDEMDLLGGLHATEHAAIGVLPLFAMCDRNDIGGVSTPFHPDTGRAQVFIYDGYAGGVGIAEKGFEIISDLWEVTLQVIKECSCQDGCPSCIQSPKCGNGNEPLDKEAAILILKSLLAAPSRQNESGRG